MKILLFSNKKIWGFTTKIWGLQWNSGGLQWTYGGLQWKHGGLQWKGISNSTPMMMIYSQTLAIADMREEIENFTL